MNQTALMRRWKRALLIRPWMLRFTTYVVASCSEWEPSKLLSLLTVSLFGCFMGASADGYDHSCISIQLPQKGRINHWLDHTDTQRTQIKSHQATLKTNSIAEPGRGPSLLNQAHFCRSNELPCESYRVPASGSRAGYGDEKPRAHFSDEDRASAKSLWPLMCLLQTWTVMPNSLSHTHKYKYLDSFGCYFKVLYSPLISVAHSGFPHLLTNELPWSFHTINLII